MATDVGENKSITGSSEDSFKKSIKVIEIFSYSAISALIIALVLIMLNQILPGGILIIISAAIELFVTRKVIALIIGFRNSFYNASVSSEKKDDVITDFSHKIREPLNNLVIITDMLMESGLQKKQKELLETFIASTKNMVTTVNELTMQSAGNMGFEYRKHIKFNLLTTIQNTIDLYKLKDGVNIDFILNKKEFQDFECNGDPVILKQIFLDIFNSVENQYAGNPAKVTINLKKDKKTGNENSAELRIQTDRNIMLIDDNKPDHSMAASLILKSKGTFSQESGNNFTILNISLPYSDAIPEPKQKIASTIIGELIQKDKVHKELKDLKILLVEDNLINQRITHLTLKPFVHTIDTASNGKEALDKFGTASYDLILMDIQMPVMSGLMAAEKIRALEASTNTHVPIIAITANAMIGDKEKCLSAGIDDYISKPFQPSALVEKIKQLI